VTGPAAPARAAVLARRRPEWVPWLAPLQATLAAVGEPGWAAALPASPPPADDRRPRLAGAALELDARMTRAWLLGLVEAAERAGAPVARARRGRADAADVGGLVEASIEQDAAALVAIAGRRALDPGAMTALAPLVAMPLLHAARARWMADVPAAWAAGYCPICGAWPAFAEARGLEGERRLRCGRCGAEWPGQWLACAFCDNRDHHRLGALAPEDTRDTRRVETCEACRGFLKIVTVLTPAPAVEVALVDLETVELDVAALDAGWTRPEGLGHPLGVAVRMAALRGLRGWLR
jgi:FdhE protein